MAIQAEVMGTARANPSPTRSYGSFITGLMSSEVPFCAGCAWSGGKNAGGLEMTTTPAIRIPPMNVLYSPQWSLSRKTDSTSVQAGLEKKMAVQSPMGSR